MSHGHEHDEHGHGEHEHDDAHSGHDRGILPKPVELRPDRHPPRAVVHINGPAHDEHHDSGSRAWKAIAFIAVIMTLIALAFTWKVYDDNEELRKEDRGAAGPGADKAPEWLKRQAIDPKTGQKLYPELSEKPSAPQAAATSSATSTQPPPATNDAAQQQPKAADVPHGAVYAVVSGDTLAKIGRIQTPKFCGLANASAFTAAVQAANQTGEGDFQAVKEPKDLQIGKKIYLPAGCPATPSAP